MTGKKIVDLALPHVGEKYSFGALVPKDDKTWDGPWDCAEFTSWLVYQLTGKLYGCANNDGDPGGADAYSGFWARDAEKLGTKITVQEAAKTPGAFVVRIARRGVVGHIVVSDGYGRTIEAHSTKTGVITSSLEGRRWDFGVLVPWINYEQIEQPLPEIKKPGKIYRLTRPMMKGDDVKKIQVAVGVRPDGIYGPKTMAAVIARQKALGLVPDGEVGPQTAAGLGLTF